MNCFGKRRYAELKQFPGAISAAAYPPSLRCSMHGVLGLGAQRQPPGQANWPNAFALRACGLGWWGLMGLGIRTSEASAASRRQQTQRTIGKHQTHVDSFSSRCSTRWDGAMPGPQQMVCVWGWLEKTEYMLAPRVGSCLHEILRM